MAKGSLAKTEITKKILEIFPGAFMNDKELRIPWMESGEEIQIKVGLTCAKTNVDNPNETATMASSTLNQESAEASNSDIIEPSEEEKQEVEKLIRELNL